MAVAPIGLLIAALIFPIIAALLLNNRFFLLRYFTGSLLGVFFLAIILPRVTKKERLRGLKNIWAQFD